MTASCLVHETAYFNASGWMLLNLYDANNDMQARRRDHFDTYAHTRALPSASLVSCAAHPCADAHRRLVHTTRLQVTQEAAKLDTPLSTHLACLHANHWDISFGSFPVSMTLGSRKLVHPFPKEAALTAMLALVHELGLNDKA